MGGGVEDETVPMNQRILIRYFCKSFINLYTNPTYAGNFKRMWLALV